MIFIPWRDLKLNLMFCRKHNFSFCEHFIGSFKFLGLNVGLYHQFIIIMPLQRKPTHHLRFWLSAGQYRITLWAFIAHPSNSHSHTFGQHATVGVGLNVFWGSGYCCSGFGNLYFNALSFIYAKLFVQYFPP